MSSISPYGIWVINDLLTVYSNKAKVDTKVNGWQDLSEEINKLLFVLISIVFIRDDRTLTTAEIYDLMWGNEVNISSEKEMKDRVDKAISRLRKKIADTDKLIIQTKRGGGYYIFDDPILFDEFGKQYSIDETIRIVRNHPNCKLISSIIDTSNPSDYLHI